MGMEFKKVLDGFLNYMKNVKNRSLNTLNAYESDLNDFFSLFSDLNCMNEISLFDIETVYIDHLLEKGNGATSRARKLSSLRSFYRWAFLNGLIDSNIFESIEMPKIPHKEPKVMDMNEVKAVMESVKNDEGRESESESGRNFAILSLMFSTGVRRSEVTEIKLNDLNLDNNSILIHGKGNKERIVYFNDSVKNTLIQYLESQRKLLNSAFNSDYLFVSKKSEKLSAVSINRIVNKYLESAGIKEKGYTAHSTRKAFATCIYEATKDIVAVQRLLGHSSIATTQVYLGVSESSKRQAAMNMNF